MDSYEFMRSITHDLGSIKIFFDATMALYQVMSEYNGFAIVDQDVDETKSAVFAYTIVPPEDPYIIQKFLHDINGLNVFMYGRCYVCEAKMSGPNVVMVTLRGIQ